ncbi:unnamed protein product [Rhizophagus irregularis]|nr:unnamed protein product [Rhizophagus irregularis]CAB4440934.1 unnamed protein product [Rhizophagus irregularis]
MKIKGGGLQTWVKTRWVFIYDNGCLSRARPVFDWILSEHANSITNNEVAVLMEDESFFSYRCISSFYMEANKRMYKSFREANEATLSDCFVHLINWSMQYIDYQVLRSTILLKILVQFQRALGIILGSKNGLSLRSVGSKLAFISPSSS